MAEQMQAGAGPPSEDLKLALLLAAEGRRQTYDQMMWQVPGLSLAAQSFLLTIALGHESTPVARLASGVLAFVAAIATIQLLLKQRYLELEWSLWLEQAADSPELLEMWGHEEPAGFAWRREGGVHRWKRPSDEQERDGGSRRGSRASRGIARRLRHGLVVPSSVNVWTLTLAIFALADLIAAGYGAATL